jgi:V/A-type H+-transporting ATPase subunit I
MDRIEIVFVRERLQPIVNLLQKEGVVHLDEVPLAVENAPGYLHRIHLSDEERAEMEALEELDRMLNQAAPLLAKEPSDSAVAQAGPQLEGTPRRAWARNIRKWSRELRSMTRRRLTIRDNLEIIGHNRTILEALVPMGKGEDVRLGRGARAVVLEGEARHRAQELRERLRKDIGSSAEFDWKEHGRHTLIGLLRYPSGREDHVARVLRDYGITPVGHTQQEMEEISLQEAHEKLDARYKEQEQALKELEEQIEAYSREKGAEVRAMQMIIKDRLNQLRAVTQLAQSELVGVVQGWVPADYTDRVEGRLQEEFPGEAILTRLSTKDVEPTSVPTLLRHPKFLKPFQVLISAFDPPTYGTMDPSILVGLFFVLFYGFILGDVAYGVAVIGFGLMIRRLGKRNELAKAAGTVAMYAGGSALIFGILYGELAGDIGERYLGMHPLIGFHRGHDVVLYLGIAVSIGVLHILLSLGVAIYEGFRTHHKHQALEKLGMLLALLSLGVVIAGGVGYFGPPALYLSVFAVLLGAGITLLVVNAGAFGAVHLMEVISLVGNILSYSRLMALGLVGVALAQVASILGGVPDNPFLGALLALLIHMLNITIGIISPTIHALRLNYVEFLTKFYEPQGTQYVPLKKEAIW